MTARQVAKRGLESSLDSESSGFIITDSQKTDSFDKAVDTSDLLQPSANVAALERRNTLLEAHLKELSAMNAQLQYDRLELQQTVQLLTARVKRLEDGRARKSSAAVARMETKVVSASLSLESMVEDVRTIKCSFQQLKQTSLQLFSQREHLEWRVAELEEALSDVNEIARRVGELEDSLITVEEVARYLDAE